MSKAKEVVTDSGFFILGSSLYAIAVNVFSIPADIAPGGATGCAVLLHHLFRLPVGMGILLINLPLFLLSAKRLGKEFLIKTIFATVLMSGIIDLTALFLPAYQGNRLLAALYGGVLSGTGLALVLLRGATTGGSDIAAKLLVQRFPALRVAPVILAIDAVIILVSSVVYRNIDSSLYACLMIFTATTTMDRLLYNADTGNLVYVITRKGDAIAQAVLQQLQRGCTILPARGAYSGKDQQVLLCVTRKNEIWRLKRLVKQLDETAFVTVSEAGQVLGEGFLPLT